MESQALSSAFEARREGPLDSKANEVLLLVETYPKGVFTVKNELRVQEDAGYELIAAYNLYATGANTFWFADYDSTLRKVYCYPQVPLTWVTLGAWQFIVPVSWPCAAVARISRPFAYEQVRHLAAAASADVAIVELKMAGETVVVAWGWLLKRTSSPPPTSM